ncbi:response regulator transcription factor [Catenuloplanes atrovinosus]|uniref:DNA-binding response OmpR family regulator n=1 Tax=Catenuloplanes atrovinosus TaxID=137266 RepID=A0AAE4CBA1_9ACTN|nr:response regulator [Catenuloplanes atrovinosus]MDR7277842.1 DNA-binding response OmpR family regulator [Catenuloplanes atrovinosus]
MGDVLRAVVIEDEEDLLDLLRQHLGRNGCAVSGYGTAEEGVAAARANPPDLIVVDVMLPDLDGREVIRRLSKDPRTGHCPIVVCSVLDADDLNDLPTAAILAKPFGKADVAELMRRLALPRAEVEGN